MYLSLLSSESAEQNGLVPDVVASVYFENMIARKIYTLLMQILSWPTYHLASSILFIFLPVYVEGSYIVTIMTVVFYATS